MSTFTEQSEIILFNLDTKWCHLLNITSTALSKIISCREIPFWDLCSGSGLTLVRLRLCCNILLVKCHLVSGIIFFKKNPICIHEYNSYQTTRLSDEYIQDVVLNNILWFNLLLQCIFVSNCWDQLKRYGFWECLVFRKKDLYLVITQKLINHEIWRISWNLVDFTWNPADFMWDQET